LKSTLILSSRENFIWTSMQEIVPAIEKAWLATAQEGHHKVSLLNVDDKNIKEISQALLQADQLVVACTTLKICKILRLARAKLLLNQRLIFYLYGQATVACWPLRAEGLDFQSDDILVVSSQADAEAGETDR